MELFFLFLFFAVPALILFHEASSILFLGVCIKFFELIDRRAS